MPVCLIHIGAPKTGTSFLQSTLWANRETLATVGVGLPGREQPDHFRASEDLREVDRDPRDPRPPRKGTWESLARQVRETHNRLMAITDEQLSAATPGQARRAVASLSPAEVHVVYTIRDLARLLPAEWQESVKHRHSGRFDDWLASVLLDDESRRSWFWRVHDVVEVLSRWSRSLPPERIHLVTVPPRGAPPMLLWERFASLLGVDAGVVSAGGARGNVSLSVEQAELLRRVNATLPPNFPEWHHIAFVRELLAHNVFARHSAGRRIVLPDQYYASAHANAERLVEGLKDEGYDVVGDLSELLPEAGSATEGSVQSAEDVTMLDAGVEATAALVTHLGAMADQHRRRSADVMSELAERRRDPLRWAVRDLSERNRVIMRARLARVHVIEGYRRFYRHR